MRPRPRKLRVVRPARLGPSRGSWVCVDEDGPCWPPPAEPRRRPQAGKSGDPRYQNTDSSPWAQGAPGLGRAERRKGKYEASRALTDCSLGRRVAVDWMWAPLQPRELIKEWHLPCFLYLLQLLLRSPFLRLSSLLPKSLDLLHPRALASHGALPSPDRSLVLARLGLAKCVRGEPCPGVPDGGGAGHQRDEGAQGRLYRP